MASRAMRKLLVGHVAVSPSQNKDVEHDALLIHRSPKIVLYSVNPDEQVSGAGQLHPRALSEPDVILSHHPAPIVRPFP